MKRLLLAILLLSSQLYADWDVQEWWTADKREHFNYSFLISSSIYGIVKNQKKRTHLDAFIYSVGTTLLIGWLKEQSDGFGDGDKEMGDMDADALGSILGATTMLLVYQIEF